MDVRDVVDIMADPESYLAEKAEKPRSKEKAAVDFLLKGFTDYIIRKHTYDELMRIHRVTRIYHQNPLLN
ncbi:hypothetical protein CMO92_01415 [Candidatus Woesearchaeota archaeon]|nr:hypothetical protein [Candidatus Woesearchaeota archaeon]